MQHIAQSVIKIVLYLRPTDMFQPVQVRHVRKNVTLKANFVTRHVRVRLDKKKIVNQKLLNLLK